MRKITFHVLENRVDHGIVSFGAPWAKGEVREDAAFTLTDGKGSRLPLQNRITAYWPDGTVKWSAHTARITGNGPYELECREDGQTDREGADGIRISKDNGILRVDAGSTKAEFRAGGFHVIENLVIQDRLTANSGKLTYSNEERSNENSRKLRAETDYTGWVSSVEAEEEGPLACVIKVSGMHRSQDGREMIPFILRFTFAYHEPSIRIQHTFLYDGNPNRDFMKAIGITFDCPIAGRLYNRHIKILGENGVFHEATQLLECWRPRLPGEIYDNQSRGLLIPEEALQIEGAKEALADITVWDSYRIYQDSARHYGIGKSTGKDTCCFIDSVQGHRAGGILAVSGEDGGIAIGLKDFWQKYPSSLWAQGISKDRMKVTAWIWSYEHEAMDYRHYDTVGHASAYYEGFDEVGSNPYGIGNTNEILIVGLSGGIPDDGTIGEYGRILQKPPVLAADPEYYHSVKAFGEWGLVNRSTPFAKWLEQQLDMAFSFYRNEIEQREWYGLYNYGDFMHTYDRNRHCWRYDMGGYAWQNTELVPTLWLWYAYLRTGREDIFTVAEAMARHCSEVDIYHIGELKGLGSRHNVLHWGCSCKEPRISMAGHHRFYYYLMGDYRLGDIFDDVKDADYSTIAMDPLRHFYSKEEMVFPTHARTGPDWSSYCSNWMTIWEQRQDKRYRDKIITGINDIKKSPYRLISGSNYEYDPNSSHLRYIGENAAGGSHLAICMGGPQTWFELAELLEDEEWKEMLAEYGDFYFATREEKVERASMVAVNKGFSYPYMAAAMGAYAARYHRNRELGIKVWRTLADELNRSSEGKGFETVTTDTYVNNGKLSEIPWISTNMTSQWCLNVIMCLELIKDYIPEK